MNDYTTSAYLASKSLTQTFSNSFSSAINYFDSSIRQEIYNIYGLVRVADEIVDTYQDKDSAKLLSGLEQDVYACIKRQFSPNIIVHSFCRTARKYGFNEELISPFFESMRMDLTMNRFSRKQYEIYIYGSAEVVGLMCLKIFTHNYRHKYNELSTGAKALGSAFQKVNFLRDIKEDYEVRSRYYFPISNYEQFDDKTKESIVNEIMGDFEVASEYINQLPVNSINATRLAYEYYYQLLNKINDTPASELKRRRIGLSKIAKLKLYLSFKAKPNAK